MSSYKNSRKRTGARAVRSTASAVLSRLFSYVLIGVSVLSGASCRSTRSLTVTGGELRDSLEMRQQLEQRQEVRVEASVVDTQSVLLSLPAIEGLPVGAQYSVQGSQGMASLERQSDGRLKLAVRSQKPSAVTMTTTQNYSGRQLYGADYKPPDVAVSLPEERAGDRWRVPGIIGCVLLGGILLYWLLRYSSIQNKQ